MRYEVRVPPSHSYLVPRPSYLETFGPPSNVVFSGDVQPLPSQRLSAQRKPMRLLSSALVALIASALSAGAQAPGSTPGPVRPHEQSPHAEAARRNGAVTIDGRLDEAAWLTAAPVTGFLQNDPNEGQPAS